MQGHGVEAMSLVISASQLETWERCKRLWVFERVHKIRGPEAGFLAFGTVLHAVLERWHLQDDAGRGPELYPKGWDAEVTPGEAAQIQRLVIHAEGAGTISREPGRRIEQEIWLPVVEGVRLVGYVDVLLDDEVQDHKSTKDFKWAKGPHLLSQSTQMLVYAKYLIEEARARGKQVPAFVTLRHNVFCKDPNVPTPTKVTRVRVSVEAIERKWLEIQEHARGMLAARTRYAKLESWPEIEEPKDRTRACSMYGGCLFMHVCAGSLKLDDLLNALASPSEDDKLDFSEVVVQNLTTERKNPMDVFAKRLAARQNGSVAPPAAPTSEPVPVNPPQPAAPTPAPAVPVAGAPPWAIPGCAACVGKGFSTAGNPCRICGVKNQNLADLFTHGVADGELVWTVKADQVEAAKKRGVHEDALDGAFPWAGAVPALAAAPVAAPVAAPAAAPTPAPEQVSISPPASDAKPKRRGRPKKGETLPAEEGVDAARAAAGNAPVTTTESRSSGSTVVPAAAVQHYPKTVEAPASKALLVAFLFVRCTPEKMVAMVQLDLDGILHEYGNKLAASMQAPNYWMLDAFKRRDLLASKACEILTEVAAAHPGKFLALVSNSSSPDVEAFAVALKPYCANVVVGAR